MFRKFVLLSLCAACVLVAAAPAQSAVKGAVVVRVTSVEFLEPTAECPVGRAVSPLLPILGSAGTVVVCLETFAFDCDPGCRQVLTGTATWSLAGGQIFTRIRIEEFVADDFSSAQVRWTGTVTGGTGAYAGTTGRLVGAGTVQYPPDAMPVPNLLFVLVLT